MDRKYNGYNPNDYSDNYTYRRPRNGSSSSRSDRRKITDDTLPALSRRSTQHPARSTQQTHNIKKGQSSSNISKKVKKRNKKAKRSRVFKSVFASLLIIAIVGTIICTGVFVGMYAAVMTEIQDMNIDALVKNHSSIAYYTDSSGNQQELQTLNTTDNSIWVESSEISDYVKNATIAIEDERFLKHNGIDIKRTIGATLKFGLAKLGIGEATYGGSTITQQVIKNITKEKDKSATRKIKEILRALALEKQCSKDEILTLYLNIVYFANQCTGIESASQMYYGKTAKELNIPQAAAIVGITQTPAKFDPYAHPENTLSKRNVVLKKMYEHNMISKAEYKAAKDSELGVIPKRNRAVTNNYSYFIDQVLRDVINDLQEEKGYSAEFAEQQLFNGGLQIHTTIDVDIQSTLENIYSNPSNFPNSGAQSGMIVIDPYTGEIKGVVGGIGAKTPRGLNRATQSWRQPGSAIKPVSVYSPAIENEVITSATVVKDEKITIGSDNWEPKNSYSGFKGNMLISEAVGRSANIPAVKVLEMLGISKSFNFVQKKLGFSKLVDDDKNYSSLSLGGLTQGVTVSEMAAAYSAFANGGIYIKPYTYTKITNAAGELILENSAAGTRAMSESTAYIMTDLLSYPVQASYGTARNAQWGGMPVYGKTGTTTDNYDKWFVGYTPYYVGAVWYGYDTPKAISASSNPATAVWKKAMSSIHQGLGAKDFSAPSSVKAVNICSNSGKSPASWCKDVKAYFKIGTEPTKKCTGHQSGGSSGSKNDDEDEDNEDNNERSTTTPSKKPSSSPKASPSQKATKKPTSEPTKAPAATSSPTKPPQKTAVPKPDKQTQSSGDSE